MPPQRPKEVTNEHTTIEEWARDYIETTSLNKKTDPVAPPQSWAKKTTSIDVRPGRPDELRVAQEKPRTFKRGSLRSAEARAAINHKFWHHELQAAELMCWALLKFTKTPVAFRKGLLGIFQDEVRHMKLYENQIKALGFGLQDFPVRDWFWERVPTCVNEIEFVALMGMGLEAANLEHTVRFSEWFRAAGDEEGALVQDQIGKEEVSHVRFATHWFREWTGGVNFAHWCERLPPPLTPLLMRGKNLQLGRRREAQFPEDFIRALQAWKAEPTSNRTR